MKVTDMYPDKWLKASHLQGKTHLVTVEKVTVESVFNTEARKYERKFVLRFFKKNLPMILNKTQSLALAKITANDDSDGWIGHQILIGPTVTNGRDTILISRPPEAPPPVTPVSTSSTQAAETPPAE